jgi:hypothetical protein
MTTKTMLDTCADMVVVCDTGERIPCSYFNVMTMCSIVRSVAEDTELPIDDAGRKILAFPGVNAEMLKLTIEVLHGVRKVSSLSGAETLTVTRGFDVLGSDSLRTCVLDRMLLIASLETYIETYSLIPILLESSAHRISALNAALRISPTWELFRLMLRKTNMSFDLAVWLTTRLVKVFPVSLIFCELVGLIPKETLSVQKLVELACVQGVGVHCHPAEVPIIIGRLEDEIRRRDREVADARGYLAIVNMVRNALQIYDTCPEVASKVYGSIVTYENTPIVSCVLTIDGKLDRPKRIRVAPWMSIVLDTTIGVLQATVRPSKIDRSGRYAKSVRAHMTAMSWRQTSHVEMSSIPRVLAEGWYSFDNVAPDSRLSLDSTHPTRGNPDSIQNGLSASNLTFIRFDIHYGVVDVLLGPFV